MKKVMSLLLGGAMLAGMLAGCGASGSGAAASAGSTAPATAATAASATAAGAKTLRIAWTADIQTMDVDKTTADYEIPLNIFDRLFEIKLNADGTTEIVKSLVDDYTLSDDGLTYNFTLKSGVTFSDGTPLTASDVKYSFTRMLALPESLQTDFASAIAGSEAVMDGSATDLSGFTITDDTHFTITLGAPFAGYLYQLATPSCSILSEKNVEAAGSDFGMDPAKTIGSGPYIVKTWEHDSKMVLEANPTYWGTAPSAQTVEISIVPDPSTISMMYQNGELDILDCDDLDSAVVDATYKTAYADKIVTANRLATTYFVLNENVEPLGDVKVRKAIQMAVDRQTLLDSVYSGDGTLTDGIYPRGLIGFSEENQGWLKYDPEAAKALLAEAGYADGFTMELSADSSANSSVMLLLQIIQQNLAEVGITAEIKSYDEASWLDKRKSGEMESFVATWTADDNDPDNFIYTFFGTEDKSKIRSINYYNTEVMTRVQDARAIVDESARLAEYAALEKQIVQEDAAWVPLFGRQHLFVIGENVESYTPHWAGYGDFFFSGVTLKS